MQLDFINISVLLMTTTSFFIKQYRGFVAGEENSHQANANMTMVLSRTVNEISSCLQLNMNFSKVQA